MSVKSKKTKQILIIEDESAMRRILKDTLEQEGFAVLESKDGEEGLQIALQAQPDFIVLDIVMPKMDGMAVLKQLRADDAWGRQVPVLILTNLSNAPSVINTLEFESGHKQSAPSASPASSPMASQHIKTYIDMRLEKGICDFLIKTDCKLADIVNKIKSHLNNQ